MTLLLAIIPVLLILRWIDLQDLRPEPRRVIWTTFLLGALAVVPVYFAERGAEALLASLLADVHWTTIPHTFVTTLLGVAVPEELAKFAVLTLYARRHHAFDEPMDGLVYGAASALGFAAVENVMYVLDGDASTAVIRGLIAVPGHAFDGMLMGALVGAAMVRPRSRVRLTVLAFALPTLCHALYDAPMLVGLTPFMTGEAPSWATVAAGCALAPLPVVITTLQWNTVRDLAARLQRSQRASLSGDHSGRPLLPLLGGITDGTLAWMQRDALRAWLTVGAALSGLSALVVGGILSLGLGLVAWRPELLHRCATAVLENPEVPRELTRLGADGLCRSVVLLLGGIVVMDASMVVGFLRAARRLQPR